ncbi:lambda exonuclease family protein [Flaviflagellibacter deserti]|uniref:Lambda exonuclease family protein n=1 Tax=Flaviflagellibacter deserti TaxID=2267266 RepID=A0ABV9YYK5_9HYPH
MNATLMTASLYPSMSPMAAQGTAEWLRERCGKVTASRIADLVARTKTGWAAARINYLAELIAERLSGQPTEGYVSPAMKWGQDCEVEARRAYEFFTDQDVTEVGFVPHPMIVMSGASPDGLVGEDGLVEIKAPNTATHLEILATRTVPSRYVTQMMWQMACTDRQWCDFVSYDPRLPAHMRLFVQRVDRDERMIEDLEQAVREFLGELDVKVMSLELRYGATGALRPDHQEKYREPA